MRPPLAERLDLEPHPEGGWFRQTWASPVSVTLPDGRVRPTATLIYFLLPAGESSAWHRVSSDELWLAHTGTVTLELGGDGPTPLPRPRRWCRPTSSLRPSFPPAPGSGPCPPTPTPWSAAWSRRASTSPTSSSPDLVRGGRGDRRIASVARERWSSSERSERIVETTQRPSVVEERAPASVSKPRDPAGRRSGVFGVVVALAWGCGGVPTPSFACRSWAPDPVVAVHGFTTCLISLASESLRSGRSGGRRDTGETSYWCPVGEVQV